MLDSSSRVPLYYQLVEYLTGRISSGQWRVGDRVPSEGELGQQFQISRTTVRAALGELKYRGLVVRVHGKGTFVAQPQNHPGVNRLTNFRTDMQIRRLHPSSAVLDAREIPVPSKASTPLQLQPGSPVIMLRRLRLADDLPMAVETSFLQGDGFAGLLKEDLGSCSLYQTLAEKYKTIPSRAKQELEAVPCPAAEAKLLGIHKGIPVLHMYRTTFDQDDRPFERVESYYRGDRYIFYTELFGDKNEWDHDVLPCRVPLSEGE